MARRRRFVVGNIERGKVGRAALAVSALSIAACPKPAACLNAPPPEYDARYEEEHLDETPAAEEAQGEDAQGEDAQVEGAKAEDAQAEGAQDEVAQPQTSGE